MLRIDKLDHEKRQKTLSASGVGRAASCPCAAESSVVIHQSAKIGQKDRWDGMMRVDGDVLAASIKFWCNDHLMRPSCSADDSLMDLTEDVSRTQLRAWTMAMRAAPKHVAGTSAAVGVKNDEQAPLIVPVVKI